MFDVGFTELLLLAVLGLLVLGPERLPGVARSIGQWVGRARSYMRQMSTELEREVQRAELKKHLEESQRLMNQRINLDDDGSGDGKTEKKDSS